MSTVVKDLGAVSAYAYAVEKGYTGTEAEFAELMADYAEVGQRAEDAAESALNSKTAAQTAATTATNKASEATTAAQTATTKAGEAQTSAQTASSKASEASQSASQASGYAQTAETAKTDAQTAKTQAETARDEAVTAKTAAETAQGKAEDAQAAAESVAESIPSDYSQLSEDVSDLKEDLTQYIASEVQIKLLTFQVGALDGTTGQDVISGNTIRTTPHIFPVKTEVVFDDANYAARLFYYSDASCTTPTSVITYTESPIYIDANKYFRFRVGTKSGITDPYDNDIYRSLSVKNKLMWSNEVYVDTGDTAVYESIVDSTDRVTDVFTDKTTHAQTYINTTRKGNDSSAWYSNANFTASSINPILPDKTYSVLCLRYNNGETQMFCDAIFYDSDYKYISKTQNAMTFTTPSNAAYFALTFYNTNYSNPPTGLDDLSKVIVEDSATAMYPMPLSVVNRIRSFTGYENKKWMVIGDSITEKNFRTLANYHDFIHAVTGVGIINCGVSGSGYKILENENKAFYQRISSYASYEPDVITVFGGINDLMFVPASSFGTINDTTTDTVFGCVYTLINSLRTTFPNVPIGIISPLPQKDYSPSNPTNAEYVFVQNLEQFCDKYCIPFLNMYNHSGFTPWITSFKERYTSCREEQSGDGLHPNLYGHRYIYPKIMEFLKSLLWNVDIIE